MTSRKHDADEPEHRFLDEAGDTTFYAKGGLAAIGVQPGVSLCFLLGMVKLNQELPSVRQQVQELQLKVSADPYFREIPSIQKKKAAPGGYYFHATDDPPEVRKIVFEYINSLEISFEAAVGRKIPSLFARKHNGREAEFYTDLLSHLIKNKFQVGGSLVLDVAQRGNVTRNAALQEALEKARQRFLKRKTAEQISTRIVFNVQNPHTEPLLNLADYFCWSVQRVFERGEMRYYNYLQEKIGLVVDLYDAAHYENSHNYYTRKNPLTPLNKLSPPSY